MFATGADIAGQTNLEFAIASLLPCYTRAGGQSAGASGGLPVHKNDIWEEYVLGFFRSVGPVPILVAPGGEESRNSVRPHVSIQPYAIRLLWEHLP